ncbi:MAG: hypothetical protein J5545_08180, partial [Bacteroidaceae bacterium]|nr:hypothetical protein [Bacteroidaceae bacterium]
MLKIIVKNKELNKSLLKEGISLPKDIYPMLFSLLGKHPKKGDKEIVSVVLNNIIYEASLYSSNAEKLNGELFQLLWRAEMAAKLCQFFEDSTIKLVDKNGKAIKGPIETITEYLTIYTTDSRKFMIDCHYKLTDAEYALCKENFSYIAAAKAKPFLILGGFSGTGKSQKVKELAYLTCPDLDDLQKGQDPGNYCLISVKPNWHDSTELLGYY